MRLIPLFASLLWAWLLLAIPAQAQQLPKLQITGVRVGYQATYLEEEGMRPSLFKASSWTPVFVEIQAGPAGLQGTEGRVDLIVETPDPDDVLTHYTVNLPLPELGPNGLFTVLTYTKLASSSVDVKATLRMGDHVLSQSPPPNQHMGLDSNQALYLAIGARLPGLRAALQDQQNAANKPNVNWDRRQHLVFADTVAHLPHHWFGYDGLDLVILATSKRDFLNQFAGTNEKRRREALAEWVQRGGHLIVCVGRNFDAIAAMPEIKDLLPAEVVKIEAVSNLRQDQDWFVQRGRPPLGPIDVGVLQKKNQDYKTLLQQGGRDVIVQGSAGLGRVTLVAFDLDQRPFIDLPRSEQTGFWNKLVELSWPRDAILLGQDNNQQFQPFYYDEYHQPQFLSQLYNYLENFEEVPVISFGWVALFIVVYILVVGPLDYFILKKVVKRLELTWITFPTVVLTVSAIAYFTAYHIKGNDLRIRKVDLVDLDLTGPKPLMIGHTWFTLFSPRIQHYTIGIEPNPVDWVGAPPAGADAKGANVIVSWLGRPDADRYAVRTRGQSLFRRAYNFEPGASGLDGVPIQVWSTKSFTASWLAPARSDRPLVAAKLKQQDGFLVGQITWLPDPAEGQPQPRPKDAFLIYNDRVWKLPLNPGVPLKVCTADRRVSELSTWLTEIPSQPNQPNPNFGPGPSYGNQPRSLDLDHMMRGVLFFQELCKANTFERNNCLRLLDQSQRLAEGAILLVRLDVPQGPADAINRQPATASRLWLGQLPAPGQDCPRLDGILRQDTFVRVFLPVDK